ncbi:GNAT family N-acetyltransferase [Polaribacter septentrionalilitoris]|uniref:GNAT family N-acetyltransferase n=1 Tax=Polaribacter septentrionalilitoris TaxID=2494657 RepID=UPI00135B0E96|nr:GNAT family N-acetyltransferase [Polaribacter septentrionalilitoris]
MIIRLSTLNDVSRIIEIIDDAKDLLKSLGIDQWQNGYPNAEQVENDIKNEESYVIVDDKNTIMGTTMFTTRPEPTYKKVIDGNWIIDESLPYGVIHRLAMAKEFRGLGIAKFVFEELHQKLQNQCIKSLKIDTHEKNLGMQSLIKKMGYQYCGIIYTSYNAKRLAFEKVIC